MAKVEVKVLGLGCSACNDFHRTVLSAVAQLAAHDDVTVENVTDIKEIMQYVAVNMPALVVNGKVKLSGRSPSVGEVVSILATELMK